MTEKSLIRNWQGKAATFVEDDRSGTVVVTVGDERVELAADEWDRLPSYEGPAPHNFDKPPSKA